MFRDVLNTVLTEAKALIDPMTKEKRVAYSFRHFFATKLIELGLSVAQIAEWLGTSSAMIEKHYIQFLIERNAHLVNGGTVRWHQRIAAMVIRLSYGKPNGMWSGGDGVALLKSNADLSEGGWDGQPLRPFPSGYGRPTVLRQIMTSTCARLRHASLARTDTDCH